MPYPAPIPIPPFPPVAPGAPVVPKLYWDAMSQEQRIHRLCQELHNIVDHCNVMGQAINLDHDIIAQLETDFQRFQESGFDDYYAEQIERWIRDNAELLFTDLAQMVFFGLTMDGRFCAYVPESWSDITFDTGMVYGRSDYGRLILRFSSDGSDVIDNTYGYSLAQPTEVETLIRDLEVVTNRSDETYDAVFTNMNEVITHVV